MPKTEKPKKKSRAGAVEVIIPRQKIGIPKYILLCSIERLNKYSNSEMERLNKLFNQLKQEEILAVDGQPNLVREHLRKETKELADDIQKTANTVQMLLGYVEFMS